jgi:TetR/AcrR family transcriptional regulator
MVRDQIISAGIKVFSHKGYHEAGMDEIAQLAGVAKGSLYYNFQSKSDLFAVIVSEGISELHRQIEQILRRSNSIQEIMDGLIEANLNACQDYPELVDLIMREQVSGLDTEATERIRQAKDQYISYIGSLLEEGMKEGILRRGDCISMASAYLVFLHAYYKAASRAGMPLVQIVRETSDLVMKGLSFA